MTTGLKLNTVVKTFRVLEFLSESESPHTLTSLVKVLNISMGNAQRITQTLIELGYLSRDPETKTFHLTSKWLRIGFSALNDLNLHKIAFPHLKKLNEETNETVSLGILDNDEVIIVERLGSKHLITTNISRGSRRPIHTNSIGKVILAFQDDDQVERIVDRLHFVKFTDKTIMDKERFYLELKETRKRGYSINDGEIEKDLFAFGVPILNNEGIAIAGINLVLPKLRFSKSIVFKEYLPAILETGELISREFGNR